MKDAVIQSILYKAERSAYGLEDRLGGFYL